MKKLSYLMVLALILSLVLTGCLLSNVGQVPSTEQKGMPFPTAANLVALWHLDGNANDSTGNGNDGIIYGTSWVDGRLGNALSFDGVDDSVDCGIVPQLNGVSEFTVEFWIKVDSLPFPDISSTSWQGIIARGGGTQRTPWVFSNKGLDNLYMQFETTTGGVADCSFVTNDLTAGQWQHVAFTWDGHTVTSYIDGVAGLTTTTFGNVLADTDGSLKLGYIPGYSYFDGTIDEVRIWDGALTADEILYSYANEILHVDDDWAQWPGAYYTINEALAVAGDGDTIKVHEGIYTDDIWDSGLGIPAGYRITKSVTLLGAQAGNDPAGSTADRGGETILVRTNGLPYSITAPNVIIDGFMNGDSTANSGGRFIIGDDADNAIIRNCIIQNTPTTSSGHGVYIYPGAQNALIECNTFYNTGWEAIASWQASDVVISHNYISASGQHAIQMMGHLGSDNEISYNHISGIVGKNAIQYWGGPGATISHNVIVGGNTMFDGIWLDNAADDSTVIHNQISNTVYAGINIRGDCTGVTVMCNDIYGCGTGVEKHAGDITGVSINYNNIAGNSWGVRNYDTEILNAFYNWWGDVSGPSGVGTGTGDPVSDNVGYDPWSFTPDPCEAKTLGFWKNHPDSVTAIFNLSIPISLGEYLVPGELEALEILKNAKAKNAYDMLAAQLLTAELNLLHLDRISIDSSCFDEPIDDADEHLTFVGYTGFGSLEKPTKDEKDIVIGYMEALDWVNINGCGGCVCEWD